MSTPHAWAVGCGWDGAGSLECWDCQAELNTLAHCGGSECLYGDGIQGDPK